MNTTMKISAALAAAAVSAAVMGYSTSANAAPSSLERCVGSSRAVIENCCQTWVKRKGKPLWMTDHAMSCNSLPVTCQTSSLQEPARGPIQLAAFQPSPKKPQYIYVCQFDLSPPSTGGHNDSNTPSVPPPGKPLRGQLR